MSEGRSDQAGEVGVRPFASAIGQQGRATYGVHHIMHSVNTMKTAFEGGIEARAQGVKFTIVSTPSSSHVSCPGSRVTE